MSVRIAAARPEDSGVLFDLIRALAEYEKLTHLVVGTPDDLRRELFGERPVIEAVVAWEGDRALGFALFFQNFSTFLARRGLYEWSVLDWNTPAIEFYESIGAIVMPDWRICRITGEALDRLAAPAAAS
jgi:hypothetical protein